MRKEIGLLIFWKSDTSQKTCVFSSPRSVPTGRVYTPHRQDINRWVQPKWLKKRKVWKYSWTWRLGVFGGKIHSTFVGVGRQEDILRWPFLPRAAAGELSSVWLQGSQELVASLGWGKWSAGSWQSWLLIIPPGRGKRNRSVGKLHNCQMPQLLELCRGFCLPQEEYHR